MTSTDMSMVECWYCHEKGHKRFDCPKLKKKEEEQGAVITEDVVLTALVDDFVGVEDMPVSDSSKKWLDDEVIDLDVEIALQEIVLYLFCRSSRRRHR
jgi:hypothetical protein